MYIQIFKNIIYTDNTHSHTHTDPPPRLCDAVFVVLAAEG